MIINFVESDFTEALDRALSGYSIHCEIASKVINTTVSKIRSYDGIIIGHITINLQGLKDSILKKYVNESITIIQQGLEKDSVGCKYNYCIASSM